MTGAQQILNKYWGFSSFRPLQQEIINSVLEGNNTLAVLPTGGGKSICFQVPAMLNNGLCIVVSPLIALMKDQVQQLKQRSIPALHIHSGMQRADVVKTLENAGSSHFKFLYVAPERLETAIFREYLPSFTVNLIAVDEAHCISQWGYDFRPAYLRIAALREELPEVPLLALTASATPEVQKDICQKLSLDTLPASTRQGERWNVFRQSFERKNLSYSVQKTDSKVVRLVQILGKVAGSTIVYCNSRRRTQEIAELLQMHAHEATCYHAGLSAEERNSRQQQWVQNAVRIVVCTNAFGMGIDKPDVRLVIHMDTPDSLESYYQEAGRAGRDGKKAYAVLLYHAADLTTLSTLHQTRYPSLNQIKTVYGALVNYLQIPLHTAQDKSFNFKLSEFIQNFKLQGTETLYALKALESDGWIYFNEKNYTPSTLVFTTRKKELYEFEKTYPQHEPLLTTLLRTYGGIFDYPVFISEKTLAGLQKTDAAAIAVQLKKIAAFGIIRYQPQSAEPQIIFRKNRVAAADLLFDEKAYFSRRDAFLLRLKNMLQYMVTAACRSQTISAYFGDVAAPPCGICDNCLERKKMQLSTEEFDSIANKIFKSLSGTEKTVEELLAILQPTAQHKIWKVVEFLQAEKKLKVNPLGKLHL